MLKTKLLVIALGAAFALPAMAEDAEVTQHKEGVHVTPESAYTVTGNVGFVTDYIFRGIAQTSHAPAVQGGIDYSHSSGVYAGIWGSNVSWIGDSGAVATGSVTMELDTYAGYRSTIAEDIGYDVGYVRFNYLGDYTATTGFAKADTHEVYAAVSYKFLSAKYSYSLGDFLTVVDAKGTNYIEVNANYTLEGSGIALGAHAGRQSFKPVAAEIYDYTDYKVSVAKDFSGYVVGLAYTNTNVGPAWTYATGDNWGKGVVALSVLHAM